MIGLGDIPSTLKLVQVVDGIGSAVVGEDDPDCVLDIAQWEPTGDYFCEFQDSGECDSPTVCWGTSDPYEPKFCTKHFFSTDTGYEFVAVSRSRSQVPSSRHN